MNYILYDGIWREHLLPFTFTRPVGKIRIGITTIQEKWESFLDQKLSFLTQDYLQQKYPLVLEENNIVIDSSVLPNDEIINQIRSLTLGQALIKQGRIIAIHLNAQNINEDPFQNSFEAVDTECEFLSVQYPWDIFKFNPKVIEEDFKTITMGRRSMSVNKNIFVTGDPQLIFIEEGADIKYSYFNTENGPIYIGANTKVLEGSKIRGPFALCESSTVKMGAKIYEGTTIGPFSKVGGEVNNSVIFGYSSKAHDGYLGNSVIGEWCNLGADTNTSNLKNTYEQIKVWSYADHKFVDTGEQFCGLLMGDHSKSGINTMFNTGAVIGVFCNIYGAGYQRNFIPSFSWGGIQGFKLYNQNKVFKVADAVMQRRGHNFDEIEKEILVHLHEIATIRK